MKPILLFDVNETLLTLTYLDPIFHQYFGDATAKKAWFTQLLRDALWATITGRYTDFTVLAGHALHTTAAARAIPLPEDAVEKVAAAMRTLPPHDEVPAALARLQTAGFRLAALTNSPPAAAKAKLQHAGLANFFEKILSVHAVRQFKPAPAVYRRAADELAVSPEQICMVAAHDWDVAGAMAAGLRGAFLARHGRRMAHHFPDPDYTAVDLDGLTDQLTAEFGWADLLLKLQEYSNCQP